MYIVLSMHIQYYGVLLNHSITVESPVFLSENLGLLKAEVMTELKYPNITILCDITQQQSQNDNTNTTTNTILKNI